MKTNTISFKLDADGEIAPRPKFCTKCGNGFLD